MFSLQLHIFLLFIILMQYCVSYDIWCLDILSSECEEGYVWRTPGIRCYKKEYKCDSIFDCSDGSDEKYCPYNFNFGYESGFSYKFIQGDCPANHYLCQGIRRIVNLFDIEIHQCINGELICDGIKQCYDGSDELYCPYNFSKGFNYIFRQYECPNNYYKCKTNSQRNCFKKEYLCDDYSDCDDSSDENYCPYTPSPTTNTIDDKAYNIHYEDDEEVNYEMSFNDESTKGIITKIMFTIGYYFLIFLGVTIIILIAGIIYKINKD